MSQVGTISFSSSKHLKDICFNREDDRGILKKKKKKVEDIATKNVAGHQLPHQMSLCSNENLDTNQHLENWINYKVHP